ncbi:hypothetical protein [Nonomuraea sp. NPDC046570]|uniref:hypothetical protein n=1 Tax=Nonomuraea sp. NPDC046570 TaxID=3155255 RepID=UPI0033EC49A1
MIERADQLVLEYVSKAADAAHGVLRQDHRLDFVKRLRARIEAERAGSENPRQVARLLARYGDPAALVQREARRLSAGETPEMKSTGTATFPRIVDDRAPGVRPAGARGLPFAGLRRAAMARANPMATGGRDARTIVGMHPRETAAMAVLVVAALLVPFDLPALAIFQVPVIVWAIGAVLILLSDDWSLRDRLTGLGAPLFGYVVGGVIFGALRVGDRQGFAPFVEQFFAVSGVMFMVGTGLGVVWLAYRLFDVS